MRRTPRSRPRGTRLTMISASTTLPGPTRPVRTDDDRVLGDRPSVGLGRYSIPLGQVSTQVSKSIAGGQVLILITVVYLYVHEHRRITPRYRALCRTLHSVRRR